MRDALLFPRDPPLLVLFSLFSRIQSQCGPPPKLKNANPINKVVGVTFRPMDSVTYKCLDGYYNVHAMLDIVTCLPTLNWTPIREFCERVCPTPSRYRFARMRPQDFRSYYTVNVTVRYVCRAGYDNITSGINFSINCLANYTWTALPVFCKGKSCGDPGKPANGEAIILTDFLYLAKVNFICKKGYKLIGLYSTQCVLKGNQVEWQSKPPKCERQTGTTIKPTSKKKPLSQETVNPEIGSTQHPDAPEEAGTTATEIVGAVIGAVILSAVLSGLIIAFMKYILCYMQRDS